jgi:hypothetical protein
MKGDGMKKKLKQIGLFSEAVRSIHMSNKISKTCLEVQKLNVNTNVNVIPCNWYSNIKNRRR